MQSVQPRVPAKKGKQPSVSPISRATAKWVRSQPGYVVQGADGCNELGTKLVEQAPSRWTVYEPMVLLPSGSFGSPTWSAAMRDADQEALQLLWRTILEEVSQNTKRPLSHLAINEPIPLNAASTTSSDSGIERANNERPNILRSPIGLKPLYGDFGPDHILNDKGDVDAPDLTQAFWVSTTQNGIYQTWAPRWTMFSRGNVKEKARLLAFHDASVPLGSTDVAPVVQRRRRRSRSGLQGKWAVDLYAGIGYFVFSYVKMGLRVLAWELNPWSVEGLRRGAVARGWSVAVVTGHDASSRVLDLVRGSCQIIVFHEDNQAAGLRAEDIRAAGVALDILHVNCGLLPSSRLTWQVALALLAQREGWLHLHENVARSDTVMRRNEVRDMMRRWHSEKASDAGTGPEPDVEHVERVKTYAPGVWHCVFDVYCPKSIAGP